MTPLAFITVSTFIVSITIVCVFIGFVLWDDRRKKNLLFEVDLESAKHDIYLRKQRMEAEFTLQRMKAESEVLSAIIPMMKYREINISRNEHGMLLLNATNRPHAPIPNQMCVIPPAVSAHTRSEPAIIYSDRDFDRIELRGPRTAK